MTKHYENENLCINDVFNKNNLTHLYTRLKKSRLMFIHSFNPTTFTFK